MHPAGNLLPRSSPAASVPSHQFRFSGKHRLNLHSSFVSFAVLTATSFATTSAPVATVVSLLVAGCLFVLWVWFGGGFSGVAIAVGPEGLRCADPGIGRLAWQDIETVRFVRVNGVAYLVVDRTAARCAASRGGRLARAMARRVGARDLAMPLAGLADDPKRVVEVLGLAHRIARGGAPAVVAGTDDAAPRRTAP